MTESYVYVYGMTVLSTIHQLKARFPSPDGYQEIQRTFVMPGGEGANCAVILRNLGVNVTLDGCYLGDLTEVPLRTYLEARGIDCAYLKRQEGFPGWRDIVFCDGESRTVFGWFIQYLFGDSPLWTQPNEVTIQAADYIALDPFFGAESMTVAELCARHRKPYVTIDCRWDSPIAQQARAVVCSREFLDQEYTGHDYQTLFGQYQRHCQGLVIFTFGSQPILYATGPGDILTFSPYSTSVVDTLGAGDTFRAGVVYGLLRGMSDVDCVRFAAACAAVVCTRFPSVHQPPTLEEIDALLRS